MGYSVTSYSIISSIFWPTPHPLNSISQTIVLLLSSYTNKYLIINEGVRQGEDMSGHITIIATTACLSVLWLQSAMTKTLSYYHHCLMSKLACLFTIFNLVPFKLQTLSESDRNSLNRSHFLSSSRKIPRFFIFCKMKRQNSFYVSIAAPAQPNNIKCLFELQFLLNWSA